MKTIALGISLMLALAPSAQAQNVNTNTNTVNVGKPVAIKPAAQPPKPAGQPAKPAATPAKPATASVKKAPLANASATGGASNVGVSSDANSSSNATGGAGGAGGVGGVASANGGTVTVNQSRKRGAASPTAPSMYTSAECANATSGSITTGVLGLALGVTSDNKACNARQDFNVLSANDLPNAAAASFCMGTEAQRVAIEAEGVDCETLTQGKVKKIVVGGFDLETFCQEPVGDWERWADRAKVCANTR